MQEVTELQAQQPTPRPVSSLPATSDFVPTDEFNIVKKLLRDGSINLKQPPLEELLQRLTRNEKEWRHAHVAIAVAAYKAFFAVIKSNDVDRCEKQLAEVLHLEDRRGHLFYRFFVGRCKFARPKSTKLATYLQARIHDGLTPSELETTMMEKWHLERSYQEALNDLDGASAEETSMTNNQRKKDKEKHSSPADRRATKPQASSDDDGPPKPPKSGKKPAPADEQEDDPDEDNEPKATKKAARPIKISGEPDPLAGYENEALARVRYGKRGQPLRIKYLSAGSALEDAENQLHEIARRRAKRVNREDRLDS